MTNVFTENDIVKWTNVAPGVQRAILAHDASVMLVKVKFEKGAIGALHQHPHVQITYVASGQFEVEVGGVKGIKSRGNLFCCIQCLAWGNLFGGRRFNGYF